MLAETMPFPNILVKLSTDPSPDVRRAVAANEDDKNWLVGRLTKDESPRCATRRCATSAHHEDAAGGSAEHRS